MGMLTLPLPVSRQARVYNAERSCRVIYDRGRAKGRLTWRRSALSTRDRVLILFTMNDAADPRLLRLLDLALHEIIVVSCPCGRIAEYGPGVLQRLYRIPSDLLVYDLQFRLRCRHCNRRSGFRVAVVDDRGRGDNSVERRERVIVAGEIAKPRP